MIVRYSAQASLNPNGTCEFPADMDGVGGKCLIFDGYPSYPDANDESAEFGLPAVIEIFRPEIEYARQNGGTKLLTRMREEGYYPYSDLEREMVV